MPLTLTVVTPERSVVEGVPAESVTLPGEGGELGILPGHAALVALLGVGIVAWTSGGRRGTVAVRGGFVQVADDAVRVLADHAIPRDAVDVTAARVEKAAAEARRMRVSGSEELDEANAEAAFAEAQLTAAAAPEKA